VGRFPQYFNRKGALGFLLKDIPCYDWNSKCMSDPHDFGEIWNFDPYIP
jgi:hypothetical protein